MRKIVFLFLSALLIATTAYAGGSILGGRKNKSVNTNGVYAIGVHVCSSLECPPVRIVEGTCGGPHMEKHWGVCVCDKGYVFKNGMCEACPKGQYSDGMHACESCPKKTYRAHDDDTECTPCPDEYAATCADGTGESTTCEDNTYWEDDSCHPCPEEGVKTCSGTTLTCLDGYYKEDYDCLACMLPFDTICSGEPAKDANNCPTEKLEPCEGATPICANNHKTCECPANCTCDIYGNITAPDGYYKDTETSCSSCQSVDANALTCDSNGVPLTCVDGYYLKNSTCTVCPTEGVASCGGDGFTCQDGYEPEGDACVEKPKTISCTDGGNECTGCQTCQDGICKDDASQCLGGTCTNGSCTCADGKEICGTAGCCSPNQLCGSSDGWSSGDYTCHSPSIACTKNSDCNSGEYCKVTASNCKTFTSSTACVATTDADLVPVNWNGKTFYASTERISSWWAAENFCLAHGKKLASLGSMGLSLSYSCEASCKSYVCYDKGWNDSWPVEKESDCSTGNLDCAEYADSDCPLYTAFNAAGVGDRYFWTSNACWDSCFVFDVGAGSSHEYVHESPRDRDDDYALCE